MPGQTQSGGVLEEIVKGVFRKKNFVVVHYRAWRKNPEHYGAELLLMNAPYQTVYQHNGKTEFLLKSEKYNKEIRIECKWQQVSGSVDEKLPYLYLNAIECMNEKEIIILIDGDGWKKGAIAWLQEAIVQKKYQTAGTLKTITVMNMKEFTAWANAEFR